MLKKYEKQLEFNRFGIISLILVITACFAGIAAGSVLDSTFMLSALVVTTMLTEAFILAVQPMRRIVLMGGISLLTSFIALIM